MIMLSHPLFQILRDSRIQGTILTFHDVDKCPLLFFINIPIRLIRFLLRFAGILIQHIFHHHIIFCHIVFILLKASEKLVLIIRSRIMLHPLYIFLRFLCHFQKGIKSRKHHLGLIIFHIVIIPVHP